MRSSFFIVALTLVLLCSLGGCTTNTAGRYNDNNQLTASERAAMERDGVRDGTNYGWNNRDLGKDMQNAGERAKNGIENTTRDITNGVRNATRDTKGTMENVLEDYPIR